VHLVRAALRTDRRATSSTAAARERSRSRRSTWTRRCTPTRGTSACRRRCSDRRSATTCCARSSRRPGDLVVDLGCGSGRALLWNRDWRRARSAIDISPFFAPSRAQACDLLLGDLRRLPFADGTFTKAYSLDVLEHLSPEALRGMLAEAARVIAPGGALFVYTHVRKNAPIAVGLRWINALARRSSGWADRHAPGTAAQVGSPEPARRHPGAAARRRGDRASGSSASATTRRSSAASSRTF
jgi:SAM-dependent methyltransferase